MTVRVVKDATLTVKAGQLVEVDEWQAVLAVRLGLAEVEKKPVRKKKTEA